MSLTKDFSPFLITAVVTVFSGVAAHSSQCPQLANASQPADRIQELMDSVGPMLESGALTNFAQAESLVSFLLTDTVSLLRQVSRFHQQIPLGDSKISDQAGVAIESNEKATAELLSLSKKIKSATRRIWERPAAKLEKEAARLKVGIKTAKDLDQSLERETLSLVKMDEELEAKESLLMAEVNHLKSLIREVSVRAQSLDDLQRSSDIQTTIVARLMASLSEVQALATILGGTRDTISMRIRSNTSARESISKLDIGINGLLAINPALRERLFEREAQATTLEKGDLVSICVQRDLCAGDEVFFNLNNYTGWRRGKVIGMDSGGNVSVQSEETAHLVTRDQIAVTMEDSYAGAFPIGSVVLNSNGERIAIVGREIDGGMVGQYEERYWELVSSNPDRHIIKTRMKHSGFPERDLFSLTSFPKSGFRPEDRVVVPGRIFKRNGTILGFNPATGKYLTKVENLQSPPSHHILDPSQLIRK